jgi:uncharacterized Fe-S cluster protein YjdI
VKRYEGDGITITWTAERCIHAAECVRGLPSVFDTGRRPWIDAAGADADAIAAVIDRCPSGALGYERGATETSVSAPTPSGTAVSIQVQDGGPLFVRGQVALSGEDGTPIEAPERMALCRCGGSSKKPFCDGTHATIGFTG